MLALLVLTWWVSTVPDTIAFASDALVALFLWIIAGALIVAAGTCVEWVLRVSRAPGVAYLELGEAELIVRTPWRTRHFARDNIRSFDIQTAGPKSYPAVAEPLLGFIVVTEAGGHHVVPRLFRESRVGVVESLQRWLAAPSAGPGQ